MSQDLYENLDAPIPTMAWAKEYGLSKAITALWDVSLKPGNNDLVSKLGKGEGQHAAAIWNHDTDTNEASIADGLRGHPKPNTRRPLNPDNWVFRAHYPFATNGKAATWDVRLIAEHENQSSSRDNCGTIVVNQKDNQQWGWLNDIAWVRAGGGSVSDDEIMFNSAGFLSALYGPNGGGGSSKRAFVATPVPRNGGFVTDGKYDGQWSQAGKFIIGPAAGSGGPTGGSGGPGSTTTGGPGGTSPYGYNQSDPSSLIHGSGGGAVGQTPGGSSPYGYSQADFSSQIHGSGGGGIGQTPDGSSQSGYNQASSFAVNDSGGGDNQGYNGSGTLNVNSSPSEGLPGAHGSPQLNIGKVPADSPHGATRSLVRESAAISNTGPDTTGGVGAGPRGDTTGTSPYGTSDTTQVATDQTVATQGRGPGNPGTTQVDPVDRRPLATEWGQRADCGIDFGKHKIGRLVDEPKGKPDQGDGDWRQVYLYVDMTVSAKADEHLDTEIDGSSNNPVMPKRVDKHPIRGAVRIPKPSPSNPHYDYSYHGDGPNSSSSSTSNSGSGTPTAGGSGMPPTDGTDPDDSDAESGGQGYDAVPSDQGGSGSNTSGGSNTDSGGSNGGNGTPGSGGPPPGGGTEHQTNVDGNGNTWSRDVNTDSSGNITNPEAPWTNLGPIAH